MKILASELKTTVRRAIALLLAVSIPLFVFAACSEQEKDDGDLPVETIPDGSDPVSETTPEPTADQAQIMKIGFENGLAADIGELYFSAADSESWGDPAVRTIAAGGMAEIGLECAADSGIFDIGTLSTDLVNYDAFGVYLSEGDRVLLTGDWETGIFTVLHRDGSKDFYKAKVRWSTPDETAERIILNIESVSEVFGDEEGSTAGTVKYCHITPEAAAADRFPELAAAFEELNASRFASLGALLSRGADGGEGVTYIEETVKVMRCDSIIVSLLYEAKLPGAEFPVYTGINIDPVSGALLTPADIVTDVQKLPHLMNKCLSSIESELEINEYRDHVSDFSKQKADYAFVLERDMITIVFNINAFNSGISEPVRISLGTEDDPYLLRPRMLILP